jgi:hypothetical protein
VQSRLRLRVTAQGRERTHGPFVHCAHGRSLFASFSTWRRLGRAGGGGRPERLVGQNHKLGTGPDRLIGSAPALTVRKKEPGKASPKPVRSLCASPDVEEPRQGGYRARGPNDVHGQACATLVHPHNLIHALRSQPTSSVVFESVVWLQSDISICAKSPSRNRSAPKNTAAAPSATAG